jgi:hypothetical protein
MKCKVQKYPICKINFCKILNYFKIKCKRFKKVLTYPVYNNIVNIKKNKLNIADDGCGRVQSSEPPKEQVSKRPLEQISQVDGTTTGRTSGERVSCIRHQRGKTLIIGVKLSGTRTEKGSENFATFFCSFLCLKKVVFQTLRINERLGRLQSGKSNLTKKIWRSLHEFTTK